MTKNAYRGDIGVFGGYYIHLHQENIGAAANHEIPNIAAVFQAQRNQNTEFSLNAYKSLLSANLTSDSESLLQEIFSNKDILAEMDTQIKEAIEKQLSNGKLEELMAIQRDLLGDKKNSFINTFQKAGQQLKSFDMLLEKLAEVVKWIEGEGGTLAPILINAQSVTANIKQKGSNLKAALDKFLSENQGKTIKEQQLRAAAEHINNLASAMISKEAKSGSEYSTAVIRKLIDNIFNQGFAEGLAAVGASLIDNSLSDFANNIELTGANRKELYIYKEGDGWQSFNDQKVYGKADSIQKNVHFSFEYESGKKTGNVIMNLGLSNKFYRTQHFGNLDKKSSSITISGGSSGLTLGDAIRQIFGNVYNEYLGFNVMGRRSDMVNEAQTLQDLIVKRNVLSAFSTRGGKDDFAQYIIANNEVVSILQLVMYTMDHFVGRSKSAKLQNDAIYVSFDGLQKTKDFINYDRRRRTRAVNDAINDQKMKMYLHIDKLAAAYNKS